MGVDFHAYSNIRTEPLLTEFRVAHRRWTEKEKQELYNALNKSSSDIHSLILAVNGIIISPNGDYIFPEISKDSSEMKIKVYDYYEKKPDFITICWLTNTVYYNTPATQEYSCGRSYSGYGEFKQILAKLNKGKPLTMPHSCTTGNDLFSAEKCRQILGDLKELRHHFVQESWEPDVTKSYGMTFEDDQEDKHEQSWFFKEFYTLISLAADCGIMYVS